jgi:hypothetical protein
VSNGCFFVVLTLDQRLAGYIVLFCDLGGIKTNMVAATTSWMDPSTAHALNDVLFGNRDLNDKIKGYIRVLERIGLWNRTWKAIEKITFAAVWLCQTILDQAYDDLVRNQPTGIHDFFRSDTKRRTGFNGSAEHISRRNLRDTEMFGDICRLRAFASTWRTQQN